MDRTGRAILKIGIFTVAMMIAAVGCAFSLPEVENVVSGEADIQCPDAVSMTINATDNTIINFNSFDILENESVVVTLPSVDSRILNRVLGQDASDIMGSLSCNGLFILVNESGIHVGANAQINAGGLILSTRDIADSDFLDGNYLFQRMSQEQMDMLLLNEGTINISEGGFGVLIAGAVENRGLVAAPAGKIALAGGDAIRLDIAGGGLISVAIEMETASTIMDYQGNPITDQIKNTGTLEANGGTVILKAESVVDVFEKVINLEGFVTANSIEEEGGTIRIVAAGDVRTNAEIKGANIEIGGPEVVSPDNLMMDGGLIQAEDTITIQVANDIVVNIVTAENVNLTAGNSIDKRDDPAAIITGTSVNLNASKFGKDSSPLIVDASDIYLNRASGDMAILESTGVGTSLLLRGPPATWGSVQYNDTAVITLDAAKTLISGTDPANLNGDLTLYNFECTTPGRTICFQPGKTYTFKGDLKIAVAEETAGSILLRSQQDGSAWNIDVDNANYLLFKVDVKDSANAGANTICAGLSTDSGNNSDWDTNAIFWTADTAGNWSDAANWLGGTAPTATDNVVFSGLHNGDCAITQDITITSLHMNGYAGTISQQAGVTITEDYTQHSGTFDSDVACHFSSATDFRLTDGTFIRYVPGSIGITDVYGLQAMRNDLYGDYVLMNDIDASATQGWYRGFKPIGNSSSRFRGTFDGQGFKITNLYIHPLHTSGYVGLFGYTYGATIQNVGLENCDVNGGYYVGTLAGILRSSSMTNCYATGNVNCNTYYVGGLVGRSEGSTINTCHAAVDITLNTSQTYVFAGGLVGYNYDYKDCSQITNCFATGSVTAPNRRYVGGLVGRMFTYYGGISNCYSTGAVIGESSRGGLIGQVVHGYVSSSYYDMETTGQSDTGKGEPRTTAEMMQQATFVGWDFENIWAISEGSSYPYLPGVGAEPRPTGIAWTGAISNVWSVGGNWEGETMPGIDDNVIIPDVTNDPVLDTAVEVVDLTIESGGILDLAGYDLTLNGTFSNEGTLKLLGSEKISITTGDTDSGTVEYYGSGSYTYLAAGNRYFNLKITGTGTYTLDAGLEIGGDLTLSTSGSLNCGANMVIFKGPTEEAGTITTAGTIISNISFEEGGEWALQDDLTVTGNLQIMGGTLDVNGKAITLGGTYYNSGTLKLIGTESLPAAFIDYAASGTVEYYGPGPFTTLAAGDNYYNLTYSSPGSWTIPGTLVINNDFTLTNGTVAQTGDFAVPGNYSQSGGTFTCPDPANYSFSVGGSFTVTGGTFYRYTGTGVSGDPYMIYDIYGLVVMSRDLSAHYALANNIDASGTVGWNGGAGFKPIGDNSNKFTGTLDGQNNIITGLYINRPSTDYVGLFGYTSNSYIQNVGLVGGSVTGKRYVGGLVGWGYRTDITNSYTTGAVTCSIDYVGGLVGYLYRDSTITGSYATGVVTSNDNYAGGLVGYLYYNSAITGSYATGAVNCTDYYVGGLVGYSSYYNTITDCYATGNVNGNTARSRYVGGLVGYINNYMTITNSYAAGNVSGYQYVGGLVGYATGSSIYIERCFATGAVEGLAGFSFTGGLIGSISRCKVYDCYATGPTWGTRGFVAGLVVYSYYGDIRRCYSTGLVQGSDPSSVGGLVGYRYRDILVSSYYDMETSGQSNTGKGEPKTTAEMMQQATFVGWDFYNTWSINEGISYPSLRWTLTACTWTGAVSNVWGVGGNWNIGNVPGIDSSVTIPDVVNDPVLDTAAEVVDLIIETAGVLDLAGNSLTVTGTFSNDGTLKLQGAEPVSFTDPEFPNSGTVEYYGNAAYGQLAAGDAYYNLTMSGTGTYALDNALTVNNDLTINNGTLNCGTRSVTVAGNFSNNAAFTSSGTVSFNDAGKTSVITGSTTFNNLSCTTPGKQLIFEAASTQTIGGTLTLTGVAGNPIILRSSASPGQWMIDPQGARNVTYVDVQDSNNINSTPVSPTDSTDSGNNINWWGSVALIVTWQGTVSTAWNDILNWDQNVVPAPIDSVIIPGGAINDPVLNITAEITDLTIETGGILDLGGNSLTVTRAFSNHGTLKLLGSEPVGFTADPNSGVVEYYGSGNYAGLTAGDAYNNLSVTGGGTYTLDNQLTVNGTLNLAGGTLAANGNALDVNVFENSGTLKLLGSETVNLTVPDTDSGTVEYNGIGNYSELNAGDAYYNLTMSGTGTYALDNALTVNNDLTINNGTLNCGTRSVTVAGNFSNNAAFTSSGTVSFNNAGKTSTITGSTAFNNLSCTTPGKQLIFEATSTQTIGGTLTLTGAAGNPIILRSSASPGQWMIDPQGGRNVSYVDVQDSNNISGVDIVTVRLTSVDSGNNIGWEIATTLTWEGDVSLYWGDAGNWNLGFVPNIFDSVMIPDVIGNDPVLNLAVEIGDVTIGSGGSLDLAGYGLTITGDLSNAGLLKLEGAESFSVAGAADTGSVEYYGSGNYAGLATGDNYAGLSITGGGTYTLDNALTVTGTLNIGSGTLAAGSNNVTAAALENAGILKLQGNEIINITAFDTDSGTVEYCGSGSYSGLAAGDVYNNLNISGTGTYALVNPPTVNGNMTSVGTITTSADNFNITAAAITTGTIINSAGNIMLTSILGDINLDYVRATSGNVVLNSAGSILDNDGGTEPVDRDVYAVNVSLLIGSGGTIGLPGDGEEIDLTYMGTLTENVLPGAPTNVVSVTHVINVWSNDNQMTIEWTSADDPNWYTGKGCGYSIVWDTSAGTVPDTVPEIGIGDDTDTKSPYLSDSNCHYFHIRAIDKAGNASADTVHLGPFCIDTTAPTIWVTRTPYTGDGTEWNNNNVNVIYSAFDSTSGIDEAAPNELDFDQFTDEGAGQVAYARAYDRAGNMTEVTAIVNIDKTDPVIDVTHTPPADAGGWNYEDVTISYTPSDVLSGIDAAAANELDPDVFTAEGAGQVAYARVYDRAGNYAEKTETVNINKLAVSGTVYFDRGVTPINEAVTLLLAINGDTSDPSCVTTTLAADGSYEFYEVHYYDPGDNLLVYISGDPLKGSTLTRVAAKDDLAGLDVYCDTVITRHEDAQPVTNVTFRDAVEGLVDPDTLITVTDPGLEASIAGDLMILPGMTYAPGADTRISGSFINSGTFTCGTGTVTLESIDPDETIQSGTASFNNLTLDGEGGEWIPQDGLTVNGNLIINSATLDLNGNDLTLGMISTFSNTGTLRLTGDEILTEFSNDTDSGTVEYYGTAEYMGLAAGSEYYHLTINGAGSIWNQADPLNVDGDLAILNGTLNCEMTSVTIGGSFYNSDNFTTFDTVIFDGSSPGNTITSGGTIFCTLTFSSVGGGGEWTMQDDLMVFWGDLTINPNTILAQGCDNHLTVDGPGVFVTFADNTFIKDAGIGEFRLLGDVFLDTGNNDLGNLVIGSSPDTVTLVGDMFATNITINSGDFLISDGYDITVGDFLLINVDGTLDARCGTGGDTILTIGGDLINNGTIMWGSSDGNVDITVPSITTGTITNDSPGGTVTITTTVGDIFVNGCITAEGAVTLNSAGYVVDDGDHMTYITTAVINIITPLGIPADTSCSGLDINFTNNPTVNLQTTADYSYNMVYPTGGMYISSAAAVLPLYTPQLRSFGIIALTGDIGLDAKLYYPGKDICLCAPQGAITAAPVTGGGGYWDTWIDDDDNVENNGAWNWWDDDEGTDNRYWHRWVMWVPDAGEPVPTWQYHVTANTLTIDAANGIGSTCDVKTDISDILACNTVAGDVNIVEKDTLNVVCIQNAGGNVSLTTIEANGDMNVGSVSASGTAWLTTQKSGIVDADPVESDALDIEALELILSTSRGAGIGNAMDINVTYLEAINSRCGGINIISTGDLIITCIQNHKLGPELLVDWEQIMDDLVNYKLEHEGTLFTETDSTVTGIGRCTEEGAVYVYTSNAMTTVGEVKTNRGNLDLIAEEGFTLNAGIKSNGGNIYLDGDWKWNGTGNFLQAQGTIIDATGENIKGNIGILAGSDIKVAELYADGIGMISGLGSITDYALTSPSIYADILEADAVSGIGLETNVKYIDAFNWGTGAIDVDNRGKLVVGEVVHYGETGTINLLTRGSMLDDNDDSTCISAKTVNLSTTSGYGSCGHGNGIVSEIQPDFLDIDLLDPSRDPVINLCLSGSVARAYINFVNGDLNTSRIGSLSVNGSRVYLGVSNGDMIIDKELNVGGKTLGIFVPNGAIYDDDDLGANDIVTRNLILKARDGIGSVNIIEMAVDELQAANTGTGDINIREADQLVVEDVDNCGGKVIITNETGTMYVGQIYGETGVELLALNGPILNNNNSGNNAPANVTANGDCLLKAFGVEGYIGNWSKAFKVEIGSEISAYQLGIYAEGVFGAGKKWRISANLEGTINGSTTPEGLVILNDPPGPPGTVLFNGATVFATDDWDGIIPTDPEALEVDIIIDDPSDTEPEEIVYDETDLVQQQSFLDRIGSRQYKILSLFESFKEKIVILFGNES